MSTPEVKIPEGAVNLSTRLRSPIPAGAIQATRSSFPMATPVTADVWALPGQMKTRTNGRECFVVIGYATKNSRVVLGKATVRMTQDLMSEPFTAQEFTAEAVRTPLSTEECMRISKDLFSTRSMLGTPVNPAFISEMSEMLLAKFGSEGTSTAVYKSLASESSSKPSKPKAKTKATKKKKTSQKPTGRLAENPEE